MNIYLETERLILRELTETDAAGILHLDSSPEVLRYLPVNPIHTLDQARDVILYIRKQYEENGTGRLAVIRKEDKAFAGWCGIKLVNDEPTKGRLNYYDIGYRLLPSFWGSGYAFEAAQACAVYAFENMKVDALHATVMQGNVASAKIAVKLGMRLSEQFEEEGQLWDWYTLEAANR